MDQVSNNPALAMLQTIAGQTQIPKTGKGDGDSDFQKLMDQAAASQSGNKVEERPRADKPAETQKPVKDTQKKPANPADQAEEAAEQGYAAVGTIPVEALDSALIKVGTMGEEIGVPVGDGWVLVSGQQLQTAFANAQAQPEQQEDAQAMDVSDPEADAMLEATAPGADNSPAAMLEKVVAEQTGQEIQPETGEAQPRQQEDDAPEMELLDVEQGPQRIFHDVEAAPVKVGEVYDAQQVDEPDVVKQLDTQISQAMQDGESLVRIQLTPENLGSVTVEISQNADGILRVALSARSSETRSLLERHTGDLQGLLSSRSQQEVQVEVQRQSESQQNQNQQNYDGHNGHAHDGQERRQPRQEQAGSQDFMQQLRLGLIPVDGEEI